QDRFSAGGAVGGGVTPDTRRDCSGETSADFVAIDDVGAVEDGQMHDHTGLLVQFVQKRCGRFTKRAAPLAVAVPRRARRPRQYPKEACSTHPKVVS
ncbi:hypothetical protein ACIQ2D_21870, partial [Lysinibacillus sp. NPDC097287]|uniref:hypothetical protein n=1 Tax=Lysinibacillus sp. NPDC097287 TaxID=3364144 RepID=UPI003807C5C4